MHFEVEILVQPEEDELDDGYRTLSIPLKINGEEIFNALKIGREKHSGVNFINIKSTIFLYERCFGSFSLVTCT